MKFLNDRRGKKNTRVEDPLENLCCSQLKILATKVHHAATLHIHKPLQSWDSLLNPVTGSPALKAWWDLNEGKPVYNMLPSPSPQVHAQWSDCLSSRRPFLGTIIPLFNIFKGSLRTLGLFPFRMMCPCMRQDREGGGSCRQHAGFLFSGAGRLTKPRTPPKQRGDGVTHGRASEKEPAFPFSSPN